MANDLVCEYQHPDAECDGEVKVRKAMTAYHWSGQGANPNRDFNACQLHYDMYREHWNEMWAEYYSAIRG